MHIAATPGGHLYWGEYFDNPGRDEVTHLRLNRPRCTWNVAYTFPKGAIRHVHNIVHDPWQQCLWILTGDDGSECRILRASLDLTHVEPVLSGGQQVRAVAAVPAEDGLYFSSDTPLEKNFIYRLDRDGNLCRLAELSSSSIYGCRAGSAIFFSTMVEPSQVNLDRAASVYGSLDQMRWLRKLEWKKDRLADALLSIRKRDSARRRKYHRVSRGHNDCSASGRHGDFHLAGSQEVSVST